MQTNKALGKIQNLNAEILQKKKERNGVYTYTYILSLLDKHITAAKSAKKLYLPNRKTNFDTHSRRKISCTEDEAKSSKIKRKLQ